MLVTMTGMKEFGALVRSAREQRGWTQTELARRVGYDTHNLIVRLERGMLSNPPTPETMRALERELGIARQTMLETMGYLDRTPLEEGDTITIRRDDPAASFYEALGEYLPLLGEAQRRHLVETARLMAGAAVRRGSIPGASSPSDVEGSRIAPDRPSEG